MDVYGCIVAQEKPGVYLPMFELAAEKVAQDLAKETTADGNV